MKYVALTVLMLAVAGLAVIEYVHHGSDAHLLICTDPGNKAEEAKALIHVHLHSHR